MESKIELKEENEKKVDIDKKTPEKKEVDHYKLGKKALALGNFEQALDLLNQAKQLNPNSDKIYYQLGRWAAKLATKESNVNEQTENESSTELENESLITEQQSRYLSQAFHCFQKAITLNPQCYKAYEALGILYQLWKQTEDTKNSFLKADSIKIEVSNNYCRKGLTLFTEGNYLLAYNFFSKAKKLTPNSATIFYNKGCILIKLAAIYKDTKYYKKAIKSLEKCITLDPNHAEAYEALAYSYGSLSNEYSIMATKLKSEASNQTKIPNAP